ncbi:MAG: ABC transporter ATP-binding protein [Candidatus Nealsonbacteria bacterium]|nr:ABC transporter ATP-binding protein [Candidatus Nealsonbacteria bacterium]
MTQPTIRVENLAKQYQIGAQEKGYGTFREAIMDLAAAPFHRFRRLAGRSHQHETFWALRDISFDVQPGEVVGIIGRNGAGKSTLLKVLSRITEPTEGRATVRGRVGSLLEVGTGFHAELTGRENVFLNGAILGMSRVEIKSKFDEIVAFAEVEKFLDTPVKRYSSGMKVRLGFAVAAHLEPEILIVDEVLSVGDASFQKKCLGKMNEVSVGGRTVLFVSHNMQAVRSLCSRAVMLHEGKLLEDAEVNEVVDTYLSTALATKTNQTWDTPESAPGNEWIRLHKMRIVPADGSDPNEMGLETPFAVECCYWNLKADTHLNLSMQLYNGENVCVFATNTGNERRWHGQAFPAGLFRSVCHIPANLLNDGSYRVKMMFVKDRSRPVCVLNDVLIFDIHEYERGGNWFGKRPGAVRPVLDWTTERISADRIEKC